MRARHTTHSLPAFPVYSSAFLSPHQLVLGGGGGASRSGIKNRLRLYNVEDERTVDLLDELELEKDEDAPMSMAANTETNILVCGINSATEKLENGQNENCRVYGVKERKLAPLGTQGTLTTGNVEDYQKVTVLSLDGTLVAVAGSHDLSILAFPSLTPVSQAIQTDKAEIYDATFSSTTLVIATTVNLLVYALPKAREIPKITSSKSKSKRKGKQKAKPLPELELLQAVELPASVGGASGSTFRAARYHPHDDRVLYTVTNTVPSRSRTKKSVPRQAFVCKWNTESWTVDKVRKVGDRGLTCFDISPNGKLLGFGSSDYTIGLLDANTLSPLVTILKAHEFPPTTLKFNPTSKLLVSGSADNSVRVVSVPDSLGSSSWGIGFVILFTLFIILLAIAAQKYFVSGSLKW